MQSGDVIAGKYRLEHKLGQGGAGVVWVAEQLGLERRVALKLLRGDPSPVEQERVAREAQAVGRLEHENCVKLFDFGRTESGDPFLVLELLEGQPLDTLRGVRLDWRAAVGIVRQIASALEYAHARGVVHRDLKPENVFQSKRRDRVVIKVLDFGLAKLVGGNSPDLTDTGSVFGTAHYMSPEQLRGSRDVTGATDMYALGVILFELLEGRSPFDGVSPVELAQQHLSTPPPPLTRTDCPPKLADLVAELLSKSADRRPGATELSRRLDALGRPGANDPLPTTWLTGAGVVMVVLATLGLFVLLTPKQDPPPPDVTAPPTTRAPPAPARPAPPTVDASAETTTDVGDRVRGCDGVQTPTGISDERRVGSAYTVVVPSSYTGVDPVPLVLFLPEAGQLALKDTRLEELAEEESFILVIPVALTGMPRRTGLGQWASPEHFDNLAASLDDVRQRFCIDDAREFAIGHVTGGEIAEKIGCMNLGIDAIATTATRTHNFAEVCAIPYLHLAATSDGYNPVDGGQSCSGIDKISFARQQDRWRELNGCTTRRREVLEDRGSTCWSFADCEKAFQTCLMKGGHNWPFAGERALDDFQEMLGGRKNCDGPPITFPIRRTIWSFFQSLTD